MPNTIIIPLLSGGHWRVIRVQINYEIRAVDILYDDLYGEISFRDNLIERIKPSIIKEITKIINHQISSTIELVVEDDISSNVDQLPMVDTEITVTASDVADVSARGISITERKKLIDQQGVV